MMPIANPINFSSPELAFPIVQNVHAAIFILCHAATRRGIRADGGKSW
jgi:hypothetical protein